LRYNKIFLEAGSNRIFGLDIIRAVAILLVLVSHSRHYLEQILGPYVNYISFGGFLGVELFFVLSGFLIGGIIIKIIDIKDVAFSIKDVTSFWIRRWFRTLPNYYFVLFVNALLLSFSAGYLVFDVRYLLFLQNLITPMQGDMNYAQSWSLTVEEWFYLLTPIIFLISIKIFKFNVKKTIFYTILFILIVFPILKYVYFIIVKFYFQKDDEISFNVFRSVAILRLDSLLYGVIIAYFNFYYKEALKRKSKILFYIGFISLLSIILISELIVFYKIDKPNILFSILFPSLSSLGLSLLIPYLNNFKSMPNNTLAKFFTYTSIISYSLYLIHFSFVGPILKQFRINPILLFLLFWILSYALSSLNYYYFERRMTKLRERFISKTNNLSKSVE